MWVIKYYCGTSIPGDAQSSAGVGTAQPCVGGPALPGGAQDTHMSLRTGSIWCLGASVIPDRVILTQTSTPKAAPASPFILLKCHHYSSDSIHLSMRLAGFLSTLHTKLLLLHYFGGNEALNSFTWIFQSLQRSSSSSQTHTKNSSTESYREQQNLVLRVTWK